MACVSSDKARLLAVTAEEGELEQKDMTSSSELSRPGLLYRRSFKAALAGVLSVAVVLGVSSALSSARGAGSTEAKTREENFAAPLSMFENIKFCSACECACEAYANSCNLEALTPTASCCRDCCCSFQVLGPGPAVEQPSVVQKHFQRVRDWAKGVDAHYLISSGLGPFVVMVILGVGGYFFMNAVFPTPASAVAPPAKDKGCGSCGGRTC